MAARLLLRNCVLAEEFEIREEGGETFLALKNPPPVGSVVTVVGEGDKERSFRVGHVVEVAETPAGIGCTGSFVEGGAPNTVGSESIAPDPEAVQAVIARDPSLASRYSGEGAAAQSAGVAAKDGPADDASGGEEAVGDAPNADEPASDSDSDSEAGAAADAGAESNPAPKNSSKKKGKKRKGRKRG